MHAPGPMQLLLIAIVLLVLFGRGKIAGMMGEVGKLIGSGSGKLIEAAYQRTADALLAQKIITKAPEGAWTSEITDAVK